MVLSVPQIVGRLGVVLGVLLSVGPGRLGLAQEAFFVTVADLPLMPGLVESTETALVFDNPGGRIVEVMATGILTTQSILAFYGQTLPQLGWTALADDRFERESEVLRIVFTDTDGPTVVLFSLAPSIAPAPAPGP